MIIVLAGVAYILIGRFFPNPPTNNFGWRLGAWILSAIVVLIHIWYVHRLGRLPARGARDVAAGAAIGGFGLALWAMVQSGGFAPKWLIALVAWPALLAIPTFVVAYVASLLLMRRGAASNRV